MARSILVVQHDAPAQRHVAACLENAGYRVVEARTYLEAKRILERRPPDLLITDVRLDGYNGLQLLVTPGHRIPAIVFTNLPDAVLEADAQALGAEYLLKPVSRAVLLGRVEALLAGGTADRSSFTSRRQDARTRLHAPVRAQVSACSALLLDVSARGLRLEIAEIAGASLPHTFGLTVPSSTTTFRAKAIWKRRSSEDTWVYGASVPAYQQVAWEAIVAAHALDAQRIDQAVTPDRGPRPGSSQIF